MFTAFHRADLCDRGAVPRRDFFKVVSTASAAVGMLGWRNLMAGQAGRRQPQGKACILLWMGGGPSPFETFSPKPDHTHGGGTRAIATRATGIHISEHLPRLAERMRDLTIIRSLTSEEGTHRRATRFLHTGQTPRAGVKHPTLGSLVAGRTSAANRDLPVAVRIGNHHVGSKEATALGLDSIQCNVERESQSTRDAYGPGQFAAGCLMARRLIESGVTFVEVQLNGWDTHINHFNQTKQLCGQLDRPFAALVDDLKQRGMYEHTLVVWMGEFGRTPRINPRGGRDHYPKVCNVVLGGGGIRGGQVIGQTDPGGNEVIDRPVTVPDLFQTFCQALAIDPSPENHASNGRPLKHVDRGAPVAECFA